MKESLNKLTQRKRGELARIVSVIRDKAPATEMIILFGSYARGDAVQDVTVDGPTTYEYSSDFDILAIVKDKALADNIDLWNDIEDKAGELPVETPLRLIAHDIGFVNRQLEKGQYFFSDIKKDGITLYDSKKFKLADAKDVSLTFALSGLDQVKLPTAESSAIVPGLFGPSLAILSCVF